LFHYDGIYRWAQSYETHQYLVTGEVPFDGSTIQEIRSQHLRKDLPPLKQFRSDVSEGIEEIIRKCATKRPADRFQSAQESLNMINISWKSINEIAVEEELKDNLKEDREEGEDNKRD
jgi:serine/threonine protein kinase